IPNHACVTIDERRNSAVSDDAEFEIAHWTLDVRAAFRSPSNQLRSSPTLAARNFALLGPPPILIDTPPQALTAENPLSSVMSSPAKIGFRPLNGRSARNASIT